MSARGHVPWIPSNLPLPYYARPDLAYIEDLFTGSIPAGLVMVLDPPDSRLSLLPWGAWTARTSAAVVNRTLIMQFVNQEQSWIWSVPASATTPASTTANVSWVSGVGSTYSVNNAYMMAVPLTWASAGYYFLLSAFNWQSGDQILGASLQSILIPTGPELDTGIPPVVAVVPT